MIKRIFFLSIISVFLALFIRGFVVEGISVASGSMEPTLFVGSKYFVEKVSFRFSKPKRGDIVVLMSPVKKNHDSIKRIIAVGGDAIEIKDKKVILNNETLTEPYVKYTRINEKLKGDNIAQMSVPTEMFFVLGDNRDESEDSRDWIDPGTGEHIYFIKKSDIKGKLVLFY